VTCLINEEYLWLQRYYFFFISASQRDKLFLIYSKIRKTRASLRNGEASRKKKNPTNLGDLSGSKRKD
jgi:hypothetical protein